MNAALVEINDRLVIALQLNAAEIDDCIQQRRQAAPLPQQRDGLREVHLVIELGETNHIAATPAAIAIEQVLVAIYQETGLVIGVQRAQPHPPATAEHAGRLPILRL